MTDQELIKARLARIASEEHIYDVVTKYADKWHELQDKKTNAADHTKLVLAGRQIAYVEILSELLGVEFTAMKQLIENKQF